MNASLSFLEQHKKNSFSQIEKLPFPTPHYGSGIKNDLSEFSPNEFLLQTKNKSTTITPNIPEFIKTYTSKSIPLSILQKYFTTLSSINNHKINALHYATLQQLLVIVIPKDIICTEPIRITESAGVGAFSTHYIIIAEENSNASLQFVLQSSSQTVAWTSMVEMFVHPSAKVDIYTKTSLHPNTFFYRTHTITQQRHAIVNVFDSIESGKTVFHQTNIFLKEPHASSTHILAVKAAQHAQHTILSTAHHQAPNTNASLQCKGIIADASKLLFQGSLIMNKEATFSTGKQQADLLLLGEKAIGEAIPVLNVNTDEVTCSHGASITKIDDEKIFYLTSRGLSEQQAKDIITEGFLAQLTQHFPQPMLSQQIQ